MRRNTIPAALTIALAVVGAPPIARAACPGPPAPCFNAQGCPGMRLCGVNGWSGCIVNPSTCQTGNDLFSADNSPGITQVGICLDGRDANGTEVDDRSLVLQGTAPSTTFDVGDLRSSSLANEVIGFAAGRAPTWATTPWTNLADRKSASMANTLLVPITIWIVTGPNTFTQQGPQAISAAIQAGALFDQERVGLDWSLLELRNATADPDAANFQNVLGAGLAQLETLIGHVNGRINVYWVPAVDGATGNGLGEAIDGDTVAVGQNAAPGLLAHEIGHCLALDHVDGDNRFDNTNVMWSVGGTRLFLTEGQAYRAHIRSISAIRSTLVYSLRPGMPILLRPA